MKTTKRIDYDYSVDKDMFDAGNTSLGWYLKGGNTIEWGGEKVQEPFPFENDLAFRDVVKTVDGKTVTTRDIRLVSDGEAVRNVVHACCNTIRGEIQLDVARGVPYFGTLFDKTGDRGLADWSAFMQEAITNANGVSRINGFTYETGRDGKRRVLSYSATIETDLGGVETITDTVDGETGITIIKAVEGGVYYETPTANLFVFTGITTSKHGDDDDKYYVKAVVKASETGAQYNLEEGKNYFIEYSADNGATWITTDPEFNQDTKFIFRIRVNAGYLVGLCFNPGVWEFNAGALALEEIVVSDSISKFKVMLNAIITMFELTKYPYPYTVALIENTDTTMAIRTAYNGIVAALGYDTGYEPLSEMVETDNLATMRGKYNALVDKILS